VSVADADPLAPLANLPVLVVGDLMLDHYIFGAARRLSPEAPVPVVEIMHEEDRLGGAANVARNLQALGCNVRLFGAIGDDDASATLRQQLRIQEIDEGDLHVFADHPTTRKTRVICRGQHVVRLDREQRSPIAAATAEALATALAAAERDAAAVVFSDYGKGTLPAAFWAALPPADSYRLLDPYPPHKNMYRHIHGVTPNRGEAEALTGASGSAPNLAAAICRRLHVDECVLTLGEDGMYWSAHGEGARIAAQPRHVYDVSGAGDTVAAVIAAMRGAGRPMPEAAALATAAAGIVVEHVGTTAVHAETLQRRARPNREDHA